jgi:hypothetical protein
MTNQVAARTTYQKVLGFFGFCGSGASCGVLVTSCNGVFWLGGGSGDLRTELWELLEPLERSDA